MTEMIKAPPLPDGASNQNPAGIGFWTLVAEDFRTHGSEWCSQGFWAVFVNRYGNARMDIRPKVLRLPFSWVYLFLRKCSQIFGGIKLDYTVKLGRRVRLEHFGGMIIGARAIGDDVVIRQNTTIGIRSERDLNAKPIIGSRVDIGAGAVIVGHVRIGDDCIIGANSVVSMDVPDGSFVKPPKPQVMPIRSRT